jgi:DNA-binding response OmpR family regulator
MANRILVINSDAAINDFLHLALSDEGYVVNTAKTAPAALEILPCFQPDLILLEMWLHPVNGKDFLQAYRQKARHNAPVIAFSTQMNHELVAREFGADFFLLEPFELEDLLACINQFLAAAH